MRTSGASRIRRFAPKRSWCMRQDETLRAPSHSGVLLASLLVLGLAIVGCGSSGRHLTSAELKLQRAQLVLVNDGLRSAQQGVERELNASRAAWPAIAKGLPPSFPEPLRHAIASASISAGTLPKPPFLVSASRLTGPAAGLAGLYEAFARLSERGWRLTEATIGTIVGGPSSAGSFARANSSLYIDAIYDAHFDLSLVGKDLAYAYKQLGGSRAFGEKLTQDDIDELTRAYSIAGVRLTPHPTAQ